MSKARELAELGAVYDSGALSNRNVLINGAMTVAQRGTSTSGITTGTYATTDRMRADVSSCGTWTMSQEADGPPGFSSSTKMLCTAAHTPTGSNNVYFNQQVEGQNLQQFAKGTSSAKQFAVSFYVKSNVTGTYTAEIYDDDNTRNCSKLYTIDAADTWEYKSLIFPADTTGTFNNDNGRSIYCSHWLAAGANFTSGTFRDTWAAPGNTERCGNTAQLSSAVNNYWQITGWQLEVGSEATPFEHRSFGDELVRCKRYFVRHGSDGSGAGQNYIPVSEMAAMQDNYRLRANYLPSIEMRSDPSITFSTLEVINKALDTSNDVTAVALAGQEYSRSAQSVLFSTAAVGSQIAGHTGWVRVKIQIAVIYFLMRSYRL